MNQSSLTPKQTRKPRLNSPASLALALVLALLAWLVLPDAVWEQAKQASVGAGVAHAEDRAEGRATGHSKGRVLSDNRAPQSRTSGRVVGVSDGDTLRVLTADQQQIKVRMAEIDTPEKAQPYGQRAKQTLSDLVYGKEVTVEVITADRYGRAVGRVLVDGLDVNAEMVRQGAAWVYTDYPHRRELLTLQADARADRRGLWALPESDRTPPWEWRRQARQQGQ